ncbi:MAG: hypothetical protein JXR39_11580 [Marinilabiliaceae bacterium]|nr:hypothetical protein [Marinilabiliaceae bacterium]
MTPDYITLSNGIKYRVEANFSAIQQFCKITGNNDLGSFDRLKNMTVDQVPVIVHSCVAAGEKMDGRELSLSCDELMTLFRPVHIGQFFKIFAHQSQTETVASSPSKKKKWTNRINPFRFLSPRS